MSRGPCRNWEASISGRGNTTKPSSCSTRSSLFSQGECARVRSGDSLRDGRYLPPQRQADASSGSFESSAVHQSFQQSHAAEILREIGAVYEDLGDRPKAFEYYEKSLTESRAAKDLLEEALTLCDSARSKRAIQETAEARRDVEAGLQILESVRARIAGPESRSSYFAAAQRNFEFYIDLLMQMHAEHPDQGLDAAALEASERARARSLLDMLAEAGADIHQGADPQLLKREKLLQQRLRARSEYQFQMLTEPHTREQAAAVASELQALMAQYDETSAQIHSTSRTTQGLLLRCRHCQHLKLILRPGTESLQQLFPLQELGVSTLVDVGTGFGGV